MKAVLGILTVLAVPLILMNMLGGVVSGIWLIVLHEWRPLLLGLFSLFFATFLISLALLPTYLFIAPATKLFERGYIVFGPILALPVSVYTTFIMAAWCHGIFNMFLDMSSPNRRPDAVVVIRCRYRSLELYGSA